MDVVLEEYGIFALMFHLKIWLFQVITGINFRCENLLCRSVSLLMWIGIRKIIFIFREPPDPYNWSCRGLGFIWSVSMII